MRLRRDTQGRRTYFLLGGKGGVQAKFDPAREGTRPAQGPSVRGGLECLFFSVQLWMPSSTLPLTGAPEILVASGGWGCLHLAGVGSAPQDRKGWCFPPTEMRPPLWLWPERRASGSVVPSPAAEWGGPATFLLSGPAGNTHTFQELTYPAGETAAGVFACL